MKISILIPCHNEEHGIGHVLAEIPRSELQHIGLEAEVIVIDNNSTDKTAQVAREFGVIVIQERNKGKGHALRAGFNAVSKDAGYVVMLDGDHTYKPSEILRLIEPLSSNFCDAIVGSRLGGKLSVKSLSFHHRLANWMFTFMVRQFYKANITDVLSGYFAWKKEVIDTLKPYIAADGFAVEMEILTKMVKLGYEVYSVPITYNERKGLSKIDSIRDGYKIVHMLVKNLFWQPPRSHRPVNLQKIQKESV